MISVKTALEVSSSINQGLIRVTTPVKEDQKGRVETPSEYVRRIIYKYDPMDKQHLIDLITKGPNPTEE
jgi:hypothetical protein